MPEPEAAVDAGAHGRAGRRHRTVAARYGKPAVRYEAAALVAAVDERLRPAPSQGEPVAEAAFMTP